MYAAEVSPGNAAHAANDQTKPSATAARPQIFDAFMPMPSATGDDEVDARPVKIHERG